MKKEGARGSGQWAVVSVLLFFLLIAHRSSLITASYAYTHDTSLIKWHDYNPEAFALAKKEGKPVFMLITAVWCHWCHVYEEKTLETKEVSDYLNKNYIPVFVDYDKRKDIASKYPAAGLPVTVIMSPAGEELASAPGYIPKDRLLTNLDATVKYVKEKLPPLTPPLNKGGNGGLGEVYEEGIVEVKKDDLERMQSNFQMVMAANYDAMYGGFGFANKDPFADTLDYMLTIYEETKDKKWLEMVTNTLDYMAGLKQKLTPPTPLLTSPLSPPFKGGEGEVKKGGKGGFREIEFSNLLDLYNKRKQEGWLDKVHDLQEKHKIAGLYDEAEGGFFRYATQRDWVIPHYEKMLSENAEIIILYLHAYKITGSAKYKDIAIGSLDYILNTLYDKKESRFYGSQDADEIYYHFTAVERKKVKPPKVDRNSYTRSNSRAVISFLYASEVLKDNRYKEIALKTLDFFEKNMLTKDGASSYFDANKKRGFLNGQLEDNAWLSLAFMEAYHAAKEKKYLDISERTLAKFAVEKLYDEKNGGFFERRSTDRNFYREDELFLKDKPYDHNGVISYTLLKLHEATKNGDYLKMARDTVGFFLNREINTVSPYFQRVAGKLLKG